MALVFQYGSNTSFDRLNSPDRLRGDAVALGIVRTVDTFDLDFTVWSKGNNCAAADIVPDTGRKIWGVLYEIPDYLIQRETACDRKSLDAIEGEGMNYQRVNITLEDANGHPVVGIVLTYVAIDRKVGLRASLEYCRHIISGLRQPGIPDEYIDYVKTRMVTNRPDLQSEIEEL